MTRNRATHWEPVGAGTHVTTHTHPHGATWDNTQLTTATTSTTINTTNTTTWDNTQPLKYIQPNRTKPCIANQLLNQVSVEEAT